LGRCNEPVRFASANSSAKPRMISHNRRAASSRSALAFRWKKYILHTEKNYR
jgi:hypothetical protein